VASKSMVTKYRPRLRRQCRRATYYKRLSPRSIKHSVHYTLDSHKQTLLELGWCACRQ